jgi:hypothetical protein
MSLLKNLYLETLEILNDYNKTAEKDVKWVGTREFRTTWDNFEKIGCVNYDFSYGAQEVMPGLLVVGKNWWLERHEYDGSEWWEFKELPQKPNQVRWFDTFLERTWNY